MRLCYYCYFTERDTRLERLSNMPREPGFESEPMLAVGRAAISPLDWSAPGPGVGAGRLLDPELRAFRGRLKGKG